MENKYHIKADQIKAIQKFILIFSTAHIPRQKPSILRPLQLSMQT